MAQKAYGGINGKAREAIKLYGGVNGKARNIVKGYVGVNGKARQFWGASGWRKETDVPYDMFRGAAVAYHGKIHIFGGDASDVRRNHYSWDGETWTREVDIPIDMAYPSVVVFQDKIHLIYGWDHYTWQEVGNAGVWTELNDLPSYPFGANIAGNNHAVILKGKLTVASSNSGNYNWWRYVCVWNEYADDWTLFNVIGNWNYYTATAYNNLAYLMGGSGEDGRPYLIWDGQGISEGGYVGYVFKYGSTVVYNDKVHLLGTQAGIGEAQNERHYAFDGDTFVEKEKTPYPFYYGSACVFKNRIHIFGGMHSQYQTEHWSYGERTKDIWSMIYQNSEVSEAGTVETNNGQRTPVEKVNDGDAIVFIATNSLGTEYGGDWFSAVSIAKTADAARLRDPQQGTSGATEYTINGTKYYLAYMSTNANYGGGTEFANPLGLPVFNDFFLCRPNQQPTQEKVQEIIEMLGIQVSE